MLWSSSVFVRMYTKVEKFRVILKNETPDYINASFVKVCDMILLYTAKLVSGKTFKFRLGNGYWWENICSSMHVTYITI